MHTKTLVGIVAGLSLIVAACGDDSGASSPPTTGPEAPATTEPAVPAATDPDTPTTTEPASPAATDAPATTEAEQPTAIISLSPTATEMLYAIGAGDQVLAVDDFSNHPPEAADKMQGLSGFTPNVEAIAGLEPDLIVTDGTNPDLLGQLDTLGISHWEGFAVTGFDELYAQIEDLGVATGRSAEAEALTTTMRADVERIVAGLPELDEPLSYYHELDSTLYSVSSQTFIGAVYDEIGLVNIVDAADEDLGFYPQLSAEFILTSNPDLIFLACTKYCGETADTLTARPGWDTLDALATGGVVEMDDDIASRWGPRIVEYLEAAGAAVAKVAAAS